MTANRRKKGRAGGGIETIDTISVISEKEYNNSQVNCSSLVFCVEVSCCKEEQFILPSIKNVKAVFLITVFALNINLNTMVISNAIL